MIAARGSVAPGNDPGRGVGMSETNFVIQVKVNQKWSTAHGLSSERNLQKILPKLVAEHGEVIRALRASRDAGTGKTRWSLYRCPEARRPQDLHPARPISRSGAGGSPATANGLEPQRNSMADFSSTATDHLSTAQADDAPQGKEAKSSVLVAGLGRLAALGARVGKWSLAALLSSMMFVLAVVRSRILGPMASGFRLLVRWVRKLAATENKIDRIRSFAAGILHDLDEFFHKTVTQWAVCGVLATAGLSVAFMAPYPGGLTIAVMAACLLPPVRRSLLVRTDRNVSPVAKTIFVFVVLAASGIVDLGSPGTRITNANINYFQAHREDVIASARSSLDREDYLAVVSQLGRFLPTEDEAVEAIYTTARPHADAELVRQKKIAAQFSFNGSNRYLTNYIVRTMTDPGSYTHVRTDYVVEGEYLEVKTTYRGLNETGVQFTKTVKALIDLDGRVIHER